MRNWSVRAVLSAGILTLAGASILSLFLPGVIEASGGGALPPYGGCLAPSTEGINICEPAEGKTPFTWETGSPFQVIAAGTSGRGQVTRMELWADGKKVTQTEGTPFDEPVSLSLGTHQLTVIELNSLGGYVKSTPFDVSVMQDNSSTTCDPPSSPGVNVCSPAPGGCNTQPWVDFSAAGKGNSGKVDRMELWIDGGKIANFPGDKINTSLIMVFGTVTIYEVDSKGDSKSTSFSFNGPC